jgi:hypothetical protein
VVDVDNQCLLKELQAANSGPLFYTRVDGYGGQWARPPCFDVVIPSSPTNKSKRNLLSSQSSSAKDILSSAKWKKVEGTNDGDAKSAVGIAEVVDSVEDVSKLDFSPSSPKSARAGDNNNVSSANKKTSAAKTDAARPTISDSEHRLKAKYSAMRDRDNKLDQQMDEEAEQVADTMISTRNMALLEKLSTNNLLSNAKVSSSMSNLLQHQQLQPDQRQQPNPIVSQSLPEVVLRPTEVPQTPPRRSPSPQLMTQSMIQLVSQQPSVATVRSSRDTELSSPFGLQNISAIPLSVANNAGAKQTTAFARNYEDDDDALNVSNLSYSLNLNSTNIGSPSKFDAAMNELMMQENDEDSDEEAVRKDLRNQSLQYEGIAARDRGQRDLASSPDSPNSNLLNRDLGFGALKQHSIGKQLQLCFSVVV